MTDPTGGNTLWMVHDRAACNAIMGNSQTTAQLATPPWVQIAVLVVRGGLCCLKRMSASLRCVQERAACHSLGFKCQLVSNRAACQVVRFGEQRRA